MSKVYGPEDEATSSPPHAGAVWSMAKGLRPSHFALPPQAPGVHRVLPPEPEDSQSTEPSSPEGSIATSGGRQEAAGGAHLDASFYPNNAYADAPPSPSSSEEFPSEFLDEVVADWLLQHDADFPPGPLGDLGDWLHGLGAAAWDSPESDVGASRSAVERYDLSPLPLSFGREMLELEGNDFLNYFDCRRRLASVSQRAACTYRASPQSTSTSESHVSFTSSYYDEALDLTLGVESQESEDPEGGAAKPFGIFGLDADRAGQDDAENRNPNPGERGVSKSMSDTVNRKLGLLIRVPSLEWLD